MSEERKVKKQRYEFEAWPVGTKGWVPDGYMPDNICSCCGHARGHKYGPAEATITRVGVDISDDRGRITYTIGEADHVFNADLSDGKFFLTREEAQAEADRMNKEAGK